MKKLIGMLLLLSILPLILVGCRDRQVDLNTVLDEINTRYPDSMTDMRRLTDVSELKNYYYIHPEDVKQFAAEVRSNTVDAPVEIVIAEAVDSEAAQNIYDALERRYNSTVSQYASYSPEQLDVVQNCGVNRDGRFVILAVCDHYDGVMDVFNEYIQ